MGHDSDFKIQWISFTGHQGLRSAELGLVMNVVGQRVVALVHALFVNAARGKGLRVNTTPNTTRLLPVPLPLLLVSRRSHRRWQKPAYWQPLQMAAASYLDLVAKLARSLCPYHHQYRNIYNGMYP